jgi:threonine/homoserine/homoserine lactone efflux protein
MEGIPPILLAGLTGGVFGLLLSIPVGPVNLTILNEGARHGFKRAALIGLGAAFMEVVYCFIAFTGFAAIFTRGYIKLGMELFSFVFMLFLGIKFMLTKTTKVSIPLGGAANKLEARIEERLHPHSAFMIGLVRVLGNVGVLVFWVVLAANFIARDWVTPDWPGKLACVAGVAVGTSFWFLVLSYGASRGHGKFSEKTMLRMAHFSGIGLLALALAHGGHILWQMAHHKL